ncbi:VG15 protein [Leucobacter chromiiresistens]
MASRDRLTAGQRRVADLARDALDELWSTYSGLPPAQFQELLLELMPALVSDYGKVAGTAAAEWYEQARAEALGGNYRAIAVTEANLEAVRESAQWAGGAIADGDLSAARARFGEVLDRNVKQAGRSTIVENARRDPARPRFARIPSGSKTCAFCTMLASRGAVYYSADTAGALNRWHGGCNCQQVPEFAMSAQEKAAHEDAVDRMRRQYEAAKEAAGERASDKEILAYMRKMFPRDYTDGSGPFGDQALARFEAVKILERMEKIEPGVTKLFEQLAGDLGAYLEGLDFRLKGADSLARKLQQIANELGLDPAAASGSISDALRYTMIAEPAKYADTVQTVVEKLQAAGWRTRVKNYWNNPATGYNGVNVALTSPDGELIELQFHTPESHRVKEGQLHQLYEQRRVSTNTVEIERLDQQMRDLGRSVLMPPGSNRL